MSRERALKKSAKPARRSGGEAPGRVLAGPRPERRAAKKTKEHGAQIEHYRALFERQSGAASWQRQPERLRALRRSAIERFAELGFPGLHEEEWRFTNVAPIARTPFDTAPPRPLERAAVSRYLYPGSRTLVFFDGHFISELSRPALADRGDADGLFAAALAQALDSGDPALEQLGRHAAFTSHPFVALNTALFMDGAILRIPDGVVLSEPLHLLFLSSSSCDASSPETSPAGAQASYPRVLVVAGSNSQATIVESFIGLDDGPYFSCPVTEIVAGDGSVLEHYRVQKEGLEAFQMATLQLWLGRGAALVSTSVAWGGELVRTDTNALLDGEGSDCTLNGLYVLSGQQHTDNHMRVEHKRPHCSSHELFKGILDQRARAVFNGRIYVHPGAQKTDAKQTNRNLLLSREAMVNSNPQLEIFADDVRCTHGSTVGQLDADALFYLRSRGIEESAARSLLTYAFASELVEKVKLESLRSELNEFLFSRLAGGEIVRHAI